MIKLQRVLPHSNGCTRFGAWRLGILWCLGFGAWNFAAADPYDQSGVPLEAGSPNPKLAKIILLAGGPSSKPGAHEYFAGCALMMQWLRQTPGVWPVMAREWPKNEKLFERAKCVVYYGDGGGKQPFLESARWRFLEQLMNEGAGLVLLHQAVDFAEGQPAQQIKSWLGGVFLKDIGCRGHWDMEFRNFPDHPVLRGVKPFAAPGDGWLYNLHFDAKSKDFVPLVAGAVPDKSRTTPDAKTHAGRDEIIAWAHERPGGGRAFAFTGCDLHKNWGIESQRRLVINGILWSAKVEFPRSGARVDFAAGDLEKNLDDKRKTAAPSAAKPQ